MITFPIHFQNSAYITIKRGDNEVQEYNFDFSLLKDVHGDRGRTEISVSHQDDVIGGIIGQLQSKYQIMRDIRGTDTNIKNITYVFNKWLITIFRKWFVADMDTFKKRTMTELEYKNTVSCDDEINFVKTHNVEGHENDQYYIYREQYLEKYLKEFGVGNLISINGNELETELNLSRDTISGKIVIGIVLNEII